jgi:hypothetical protein
MPEMEFRWPDGIGIDFIWLQIWGYVGWPNDDKERAARMGRYFLRQLAAVSSDQFTIKSPTIHVTYNLRAAGPKVRKELFASARRASLEALEEFDLFQALLSASGTSAFPMSEIVTTGFIMLLIRSIDVRYPELRGGSIRKAVFLTEDIARKQSGGVLIRNERDIRRTWAKFRDVAHLAAATVFRGITAKEVKSLETCDDLPIFLAIARDFEQFGTTFYPHARKHPLLDQKTIWSVPKDMLLPDAGGALTIPLEEMDLAFLQNYKVWI